MGWQQAEPWGIMHAEMGVGGAQQRGKVLSREIPIRKSTEAGKHRARVENME